MAKAHISLLLCVSVVLLNVVSHSADEASPAIFVLGDSTADVGTNQYLPETIFRADFPPYGIDFPHSRPTGRFSNGFNSADFVAKLFGLKRSPPPYMYLLTLNPHHFRKHLLRGANFASAGAGILDITGPNGSVVPLSQQISQVSEVKGNLTLQIGSAAADSKLSRSMFFISVGSNDIFGYFKANSTMQKNKFIAIVISTYSDHIMKLYKLGARKFGIISVPPVGCCPSQRLVQKALYGADGCFELQNDFALTFHSALDTLLSHLSTQLPGFKYSLGNGYKMSIDVINNPRASGFENVDAACCGDGLLNAQVPCNSSTSVCSDRRKFLFWDMFHPTKKAAFLAAQTLYNGPPYYVSPINFSQLAKDY
ncbi:GDSL esterase/lipase At5g55050-like [Salvia miltiorrhiza]|uniref:GDSL esterase/lipase At5g55050-like n=1 Tax=Salvia miltiorrhiza TaxID=226208 RepID=UPI0025ACA893|nr:GDSL esterase/lipase At5g55050-like [Salvia miltiorrhiza]